MAHGSVAGSLLSLGRYGIRDFIAPDRPEEPKIMTIGKIQAEGDVDPLWFVERFTDGFRGWDKPSDQDDILGQLRSLRNERKLKAGAQIVMPNKYTMEFAGHYSWAKRLDDEIKEKYVHKTKDGLMEYVLEQFHEAHMEARPLFGESWHQPGYSEHVVGRLDFSYLDGRPSRTPVYTGLVAVERVG